MDIEGLGFPLQSEPISQDESNGLHYEIDIGAYIGITGDEATLNTSVRIGLGEFSGVSEDKQQPMDGGVENIDIAFANNEVWSDEPNIVLAVQVRGSFRTSRLLEGEMVSAVVSHSMQHINSSCYLWNTMCTMNISLKSYMSWFTATDESVNVMVSFRNQSITKQVTLKPVVMEDSTSNLVMKLPAHLVFPGDIIDITVYARYNHLLSSFSLNCSVGEYASIIEFTGSKNWSLIQTFPSDDLPYLHASVSGFRNYDTDNVEETGFTSDHLATLSVAIDTVPMMMEIPVMCVAVGLLLTTKESPEVNIFVNATDRQSVRIGNGLLFAQPVSAVKLFAHASISQVINTAILTEERQALDLAIEAFYTNGSLAPVTENLACISEESEIIKVESDCVNVFFDGMETTSGVTSIMLQQNDGIATGSISFRVWLPSDPIIEVGNDTLNKINTPCSESNPLYQRTHVHVVTSLISSGQAIDSVYITSALLPHLHISNNSVLRIDTAAGELVGVSAGEAEITISSGTMPSKRITVSDKPVEVWYLDVFIFSGIQVNFTSEMKVDIWLLQEFSYINSEVNVVSVAVFSDGQRQVLDGDMLAIDARMSDALDEITNSRYVIAKQVNQVGFDVTWQASDECNITHGYNTVYFNSSTPLSIEITTSPSVVANSMDTASLVGIPSIVSLKVLLVYENDKTADITSNRYTQIKSDEEHLITISGEGEIEAKASVNGTAVITAWYSDLDAASTSLTIVQGERLTTLAHPYPPYEGSNDIDIDTLRKIGASFQMVEIEVQLNLTDGSEYDISANSALVMLADHTQLRDNVLEIPDTTEATSITINVTFGSLSDELILRVNSSAVLDIKDFHNVTFKVSGGLNQYLVEFGVIFERSISLNRIPTSDYPDLVEFYTESPTDALNISTQTGLIQILSNSNEPTRPCIRSKTNHSVYTCTDFIANLQPESGDIDLGEPTGLPLMTPVNVSNDFNVPVILNLNSTPVGIFEMEVTFNNHVQFVDITQGVDWETGQLIYVDPASGDDHITFGGILHAGVRGSQLHLANIGFRAVSIGQATFSANVSFIASTDINTTLLAVDRTQQVSESSRVSVEVIETERRRRSDVENWLVEEPPLLPPNEFNRYSGVRRLRRQSGTDCIPNSVVGDANGDCTVDLRDVFLLQLYVAESVFNFSSSSGQALRDVVNEDALVDFDDDGIFTLSDIQELEIITLNLAYEADLNASVNYNASFEECAIEVLGLLRALSGELPPSDISIHIVIGFLSAEEEFGNVFGSTSFSTIGVAKSNTLHQPYYGGTVKMNINNPDEITEFRLDGRVEAVSVGFNVSVAVIVTDLANTILSFSNDVLDLEEARLLLDLQAFPLPHSIPLGVCEPPHSSTPVVIPSTSSASLPSSSPSSSAVTISSSITQSLSSVVSSAPVVTSSMETTSSPIIMPTRESTRVVSSSSPTPVPFLTRTSVTTTSVPPSTSTSLGSILPTSTSITQSPPSVSQPSAFSSQREGIGSSKPPSVSRTKESSSSSTYVETPTVASPESSATAQSIAGLVAGVLSSIIIVLLITLTLCGVYVGVRRKKGHYLIDEDTGIHIRRNSMISNSSSFWQHAENGIVSSCYVGNESGPYIPALVSHKNAVYHTMCFPAYIYNSPMMVCMDGSASRILPLTGDEPQSQQH